MRSVIRPHYEGKSFATLHATQKYGDNEEVKMAWIQRVSVVGIVVGVLLWLLVIGGFLFPADQL